MKLKRLLLASTLLATSLAYATPVYQTTFQGATFTVTPISSTEFTFDILGANALIGDWAGATFLGAFAFNAGTIGVSTSAALTATLINPATGQATASIPGGLNAGGCNGSGNFICFNLSPNVAVANDLLFDIIVTGGEDFNFSTAAGAGPDLKIDWTKSSTSDSKIGSLYSAEIPLSSSSSSTSGQTSGSTSGQTSGSTSGQTSGSTSGNTVPEPGVLALLGIGLLGQAVLLRQRRSRQQ
jgi:hypothetical protein